MDAGSDHSSLRNAPKVFFCLIVGTIVVVQRKLCLLLTQRLEVSLICKCQKKEKKIPDEIIGGVVAYTTPFPICLKPLFQNEAKHEAIDMKLIFYSHGNETHFPNKGFALS